MANEVIDNDYSLSRVPEGAKQPLWQILMIRIGASCCVSQLVLGATLGYGMSFWGAFWATMLGSVILQVVSWALGTAAAREGLSTSLLSRWCGLGKNGSAILGGVVAISMVGWFGVQNSVFAEGMLSITGVLNFPIWAIITGLGITLLVIAGIRWIARFATVFVPLFIAAVVISAAIVLQDHSLIEFLNSPHPGPELAFGTATTMVAGGLSEEWHPGVLDDPHRHVCGRARYEPACRYSGSRNRNRQRDRHHDGNFGCFGRDYRRCFHR